MMKFAVVQHVFWSGTGHSPAAIRGWSGNSQRHVSISRGAKAIVGIAYNDWATFLGNAVLYAGGGCFPFCRSRLIAFKSV